MRRLLGLKLRIALVLLASLGLAPLARAEDIPPSLPPPPVASPPPGYPLSLPPPSLSPAGYQAPLELPYTAGEPIPLGYRLVEEPRYGLVTAGWVLTGVTYGLGAAAALSANFDNASGFMLVPFVGPWLTLGRRDHADCSDSSGADDGLRCVGDVFVILGIVADGLLQAGGAALLFSGYLAKRAKLVRANLAWSLSPRPIGSGYGLAATGAF